MNRERRLIRMPLSEEIIPGDNFTMSDSEPATDHGPHSVEMRPAESTERVRDRIEHPSLTEEQLASLEYAARDIKSILEGRSTYSETLLINPDGTLNLEQRPDGVRAYLGDANTPEELYKIAQNIEGKHPEFKFTFERGPEGNWIKYTVTKVSK